MKKVFQTKLKNITKVLALVIVAGLATFTGCKSYDSDISQLNTDIATLRTDLTTQMNNLNSATTTAVNAQIATLTTQLTADEAKLAALQTSSTAQAAQITALQSSITTNTASIAALQDFKASATADIATLKTQVAAAAKQSDLTALQTTVNSFILSTNTTLTTLGVRVTTVETNLTAAQADIATLKGQVDAQLALITGLQATVTTNTADIAQLKTDLAALQASVATLLTKVNQNTTDIAANTAAIAALSTKFSGITANFKALANAMSLNFAALSSRLTSLEFVADFNVNGIAAMNFSPLTSECNAITPSVTVAYHLNPSFITAADIETGNMSFVVLPTSNLIYTGLQSAKAVADAPKIRAIFNKIENGKIYVDVKVDDITVLASTLGLYGTNAMMETFNSIALQVPLSQKAVQENAITFDANDGITVVGSTTYPTDRVITSAYVRLFSQNILASNINLVRTIPSHPIYNKVLLDAEALSVTGIDGATTTDSRVVELPYGQDLTLDLVNEVIAWYNGSAFDVVKYGLNFKFDLLDASGNVIVYKRGTNMTDQQQFIQIVDAAKGTIKAKVFTQAQIDAAQGRTPIVRVTMYNDLQPTCSVLQAFIKIHIADKPLPTPVTVAFNFNQVVAGCDSVKGVLTVQQMNEQLYNRVSLSKDEFTAIYHLDFPSLGDGLVKEVPDANQTTTTVLLSWGLSANQIWAKLATSDPATFTATAVYRPTIPTLYPLITITFTRTVTKPSTLDVATIITNYWYPIAPVVTNTPSTSTSTAMPWNYVKHNIYVPNVGETNSALAIFSNNINQAFEENADHSLKGLSNYQYYFIPNTTTSGGILGQNDNSQPIMTVNGVKYQLTPSADGQTLWNGSDLVATINPFVTNIGNNLVLNQSSPTAKLLLNADKEFLKVRIGIRTIVCPDLEIVMPVTVKGKPWFDVVFVRPINPQAGSGDHFVDALNFGDQYTYLEIAKLTNLQDWRYTDPVAAFSTHANYYQYYGISNIAADVANIKTDLNQAAGVTVPLSNYPDVRVAYALTVPGVTAPTTNFFGYLTYNNTGNTLGVLFNLYVPVTITYSWGTIQSATVVVPVWKTVGSAGVKKF